MTTDFPGENVPRLSLDDESVRQALEFKWYHSEGLGYDAGPDAFLIWENIHWPGFLRARWVEHMLGERYWIELSRAEFGLLTREFTEYPEVLDEIIEQLKCGGENLTFILSLRNKSQADQRKIRKILRRIGINEHRLPCKVRQRLTSCVPC